ncbi:cytochrome-c oxidase [Paenibacillus piri]|uniref:Cytochrome-c oxidase n=1 Tax=Paenibacillus piri TaxID=2547395 RepID=A0A4V2ZTY6_9BACL|nr:cytochrome-c oxidase [Paenibacillus piri]TDF98904.1 cytochrome-c oxidase [Paenibacillus piri]
MGANLIKIASVYFVVGVLFGMFMSISHKFEFASVHAHINLVGWVSLALAGFVYHVFPKAAGSALGKLHFWLHNIGLPIMMIGLVLLVSGVPGTEPIVATGGTITAIAVILFMINVLKNVSASKDQSITPNKTTSM